MAFRVIPSCSIMLGESFSNTVGFIHTMKSVCDAKPMSTQCHLSPNPKLSTLYWPEDDVILYFIYYLCLRSTHIYSGCIVSYVGFYIGSYIT